MELWLWPGCSKTLKNSGAIRQKVFVGGMSAGAYLALIITMDKDWLKPYGFSYKDLAGIISISGQTSTHFYVAEELNLGPESKYAPLEHLSKDLPPMLIIVGDASCDIQGRAEENVRNGNPSSCNGTPKRGMPFAWR